MATTYTSTIEVRCRKEHTCVCCGGVYDYDFYRKITGTGGTAEKATIACQNNVAKAIEKQVDQQPCPNCGMYQPDMIAQQRGRRHRIIFWSALVAFLVILILKVSYAINTDTAVWAAVIACAAAVFAHIGFDLQDPNRSPDVNQQVAMGRVSGGTVRHTPVKVAPGARESACYPKSLAHRLALCVAVGSLALVVAPEVVRMTQHWPLNAECYPPVVGPGDETRIYMDDKIHSLKGYWRGNAHATLREEGSKKPLSVNLSTNQNNWGSSISAKSSETDTSSRPWVSMVLPPEASLAQKNISCDIDLKVDFPSANNSSSFSTVSRAMHRHVDLQMAPLGAGAAYNHWWWTGSVLGMGLILVCGQFLIMAANALRRKAKPTRVIRDQPGGYVVPPPIPPRAG